MKKLINDPHEVVDETLSGLLKAYPSHFRQLKKNHRVPIRCDAPIQGKVTICTGRSSEHLPLFLGYVGPGLLDGVAVGNVFPSPSADDMFAAVRAVHGVAGVLICSATTAATR